MIRSLIFGLALLAATLSPQTSRNSPYSSALAPGREAAAAATHCANKTCASVGGGCVQFAGYFCAKSGGQCFTKACQ
jgi:hypothetical protein